MVVTRDWGRDGRVCLGILEKRYKHLVRRKKFKSDYS
jgi:hypothetical protein